MGKTLENTLAFSGGEFSPLLDARVDHPKYSVACRQMQNMIALKHGGATRRPGMGFKARAKFADTDVYDYTVRLVPFTFSPTTSFVLEFGHQYIRFYSNKQQVVVTGAPIWVFGQLYRVGEYVRDPGDANNTYLCIEDVASPTQPHNELNKWVLQSILEVRTPYTGRQTYGPSIYDVDIWKLVICQINDVVYIVHPNYAPRKLERFSDTIWKISEVVFSWPAMLDQNATGILLGASATTGTVTVTASAPAWLTATLYTVGQSVSSGGSLYTCIVEHTSSVFATDFENLYWELETIFRSTHVDSYWRISHVRPASSIQIDITGNGTSSTIEGSGKCTLNTFGTWSADVSLERSDDKGVTWNSVRKVVGMSDTNASIELDVIGQGLFRIVVTNYTADTGTPRAQFSVQDAVVSGLVRITAVASAYSATATVVKQLYSTDASPLWYEGAWSRLRGYPRAITAFQQRMIYGSTAYEPQRIWGSQINDIENFDLADQTLATDAFAFDLAAVARGPILWIVGQVDLFVGFSGAEWIVNAGDGAMGGSTGAIGPTSINAGEHSSWGSADGVQPAVVGNAVLYPQRTGRTIQQMQFSVYTNKYMSADLTSLSEHLFGPGIAQMAYQPLFRSQGMVWVVTKSGALACMTYDQQSEVYAWHRHITGVNTVTETINFVESVVCIPGQGTDDDQVWVSVDRPSGDTIELINSTNWETAIPYSVSGLAQPSQVAAVYLDSYITVTGPATNVITGLDHLNNRDVLVCLNGEWSYGPFTVSAGQITVENYEPAAFNSDVLHVGLPMPYKLQAMRLDVDGRYGIIMGVMKALSKVFLRLYNSCGGKVAGNGTKKVPIEYRRQSQMPTEGVRLFTGQKELVPESTQTEDPIMVIEGSDPFPLTVLATTVRMGVSGGP